MSDTELSDSELIVDAVRLDVLHSLPFECLLPYVLSSPLKIAGPEQLQYALLLNLPISLEVELGYCGTMHVALLLEVLLNAASHQSLPDHLRTDGKSVWSPT